MIYFKVTNDEKVHKLKPFPNNFESYSETDQLKECSYLRWFVNENNVYFNPIYVVKYWYIKQ